MEGAYTSGLPAAGSSADDCRRRAVGEWQYWVLGSAVQVALLGSIAYHAWTWPRVAPSRAATAPVSTSRATGTSVG